MEDRETPEEPSTKKLVSQLCTHHHWSPVRDQVGWLSSVKRMILKSCSCVVEGNVVFVKYYLFSNTDENFLCYCLVNVKLFLHFYSKNVVNVRV